MDDAQTDAMGHGAPLSLRREAFAFTGTAREYFGIWIVNVLLTIVTLGVYSAWAKVRRTRYFYGSTVLAGSSFEYHARPLSILAGRAVVLAIFALYNLALYVFPVAALVLTVASFAAVPWFVVRGLRFSARVTSYRNVRFDFRGGYRGAFLAYVVGGFLAWGTLGVLAPVASRWAWGYTLGNLTYGGRPVQCDPRLERLYGQIRMPAIVFVGGILLFALVSAGLGWVAGPPLAGRSGGNVDSLLDVLLLLTTVAVAVVVVLFLFAGLLYAAGARNVALNETVIDGRHCLASNVNRWRYAWITVSNFAATVASLGLLRPWAAVRMARFLAAATALHSLGSLDDYLGSVRDEGTAVGSEYIDVEGIDLGF